MHPTDKHRALQLRYCWICVSNYKQIPFEGSKHKPMLFQNLKGEKPNICIKKKNKPEGNKYIARKSYWCSCVNNMNNVKE